MIEVFGIEFKNLAQLTALLGYKSAFSNNFLKQKYGDIENLVCTRLGVSKKNGAAALKNYLDSLQVKKETEKSLLLKSILRASINAFISDNNNIEIIASSQNRTLSDKEIETLKEDIKEYLTDFNSDKLY